MLHSERSIPGDRYNPHLKSVRPQRTREDISERGNNSLSEWILDAMPSNSVSKGYLRAAVGIAGIEFAQKWIFQDQINKNIPDIDPNSLIGIMAYNTGDFGNGFAASLLTDMALRVGCRRLDSHIRSLISFSTGVLATVLAETIVPMGTPRTEDIAAGVLGASCHLGLYLCLEGINKHQRFRERLMSRDKTYLKSILR